MKNTNKIGIIQKMDVVSAGKLIAGMYAVIGLIMGLFVSIASAVGMMARGVDRGGAMFGILGIAAIVALPLFYGAIGFVGGALGAFMYNVAAKFMGGIKLTVQIVEDTPAEAQIPQA